ncbi:Cell wall hydrolase/autolysin, catalytic [Syntrophomonas zehnderi OL-4]|uniref:Cell wall hydrolase/autolysin, catalytic n=1 Tax=Syntrophomonas zehnderi OL-4 TaxID=690567 RepID=A0A0E4GE22_9FIRM|nr:N-acetylmuramoyl-L-alanine amidase [Syntrophomonas zehnderi]CFX72966.1 Cell wall hydrolase/autolysin, catalytic [Syntrophomonas zehnderi OL-4]
MARLCLDYGHGGNDPGAVYKGRKEADDVLSLGRAVAAVLRRHGVIVDETRAADVSLSLKARCDFENMGSFDYFISFHRNAFKPETAAGVETYTYLNPSAKSKEMAENIQSSLVRVGFVNRGVKEANFHVLRETKAPAILIEIGFIDNSQDNALFDAKRDEIVKAVSGAILSQLGLAYIEESQIGLEGALEVLVRNGILKSPEYWLGNAREGKTIKGEYGALLIERMGEFILSNLSET